MRRSRVVSSIVAVALAGCGAGHGIQSSRMGAVYAAKPPACGVRFENLDHQEASAKYEMIGLVTVYDMASPDLTDPVKRDVEREACKLGADAVTLNAGTPNALQFAAWHAR